MRANDALIGAVLLAFAIALLAYAATLPGMPGQNVGPAAFPSVIAVGLAGCAVLLIAGGIRRWRTERAVHLEPWARDAGSLRNLALVVGLVLLYVFAGEAVGFVPLAAVILLCLFLSAHVRLRTALPLAIGVALAVHYAFHHLLRVPLPWGVLQPLAW